MTEPWNANCFGDGNEGNLAQSLDSTIGTSTGIKAGPIGPARTLSLLDHAPFNHTLLPTDKKSNLTVDCRARQPRNEQVNTSTLCYSDELTIVREHMNFIVDHLVSPEFK